MASPTVRLSVFFDGTDNTPKDRTNVWRLHELLADRDAAGVPQLKLYIKGVGTNVGQLVSGSIFGAGISSRIREAYSWLADNHVDGAEIYVFGFSRGAFSARSLVQFIASCGLPRRTATGAWSTDRAFQRYEAISQGREEPIWRLRYWDRHPDQRPAGWTASQDDRVLSDDSQVQVVKVRMAGLWDTVGALGKDAITNHGALTQKSAEHNVRPTKAQEYGFHAVAIDEHRPMFDVTLWRTFAPQGTASATMSRYVDYYEQRWFAGAHSDVGGGYGDDRLPDHSLAWMLQKASGLGLALTHVVEPQPGSWLAPIHDSFEAFAGGVLNIWEKVMPGDQHHYREIGRQPKAVTAADGTNGDLLSIHETIDPSVLRRWTDDPTYRPPSLVDYFRRTAAVPAGTSLAQRTQRICANAYWNPTGVFLRPDTRYRARVVPGIGEPLRDASNTASSIAGEDWHTLAYRTASLLHGKRKDDARWFALIATVDKKHPWILSDGGVFSVAVGGQLVCYFNDVQIELFYRNNSGWVVLEIEQA